MKYSPLLVTIFVTLATDLTVAATEFSPRILQRLKSRSVSSHSTHVTRGSTPKDPTTKRSAAQYFNQKITHFPQVAPEPTNTKTFKQRWWYDPTHYKPGGPIILLDAGATSGDDKLAFFKKGIIGVLAQGTGGMGVLLEHRFYGKSNPFGDLSTASLRYLDAAQSLADSAYFMQNVVYPGFEQYNLTAPNTPYIYYGGGHAGGKAAFLKKQYPDLVWGAIASSALTNAQADYWEYFDIIRQKADPTCMSNIVQFTVVIDDILSKKNPALTKALKTFMALPGIIDERDFVNALTLPLLLWEKRNWQQGLDENNKAFDDFCGSIIGNIAGLQLPSTASLDALMQQNGVAYPASFPKVNFQRYAAYFKGFSDNVCDGGDQNVCFVTVSPSDATLIDLEQTWRSWRWQMCTEYGSFITAAPRGTPSLVSRLIDINFSLLPCASTFGNAVPRTPKVANINKFGSYGLSAPRLAFIDGSDDPYIQLTPHSTHAPNRQSTSSQPFSLLPGAVRHWDQNSLEYFKLANEPTLIKTIHNQEVAFVKQWVSEFN